MHRSVLGLAAVATVLLVCMNPAESVGIDLSGIIDEKLVDIRKSIRDTGMDPLILPSDSDDFQITLFNHTLNATVWLGEGSVTGLGTVHRTGKIMGNITSFSPLTVDAEGSAGITGPHVKYFAGVTLGPLSEKIGVEFQIPLFNLDFKVHTDLKLNGTKIEECAITDFVDPRIELSGIGIIDSPVFTIVINAATNFFHKIVQTEVSKYGCELIEKLVGSFSEDELVALHLLQNK